METADHDRAGGRFLVELQPGGFGFTEVEDISRRAHDVARMLRDGGSAVRFLRAVVVPEDGSCMLIWDGQSRAEVEAAVGFMGHDLWQITEAMPAPARVSRAQR